MNKFGMVIGLAAVATLAGCKDPNYRSPDGSGVSQNEVKYLDTTEIKSTGEVKSTGLALTTIEPVLDKKCMCAPGTKHTEPCGCGAADCKCVVEPKTVITTDLSRPTLADESEYTTYIVQNGDYLSKISKKYNVTINSIRRLNPSIKGDLIRVGQKLKLPGKIDVGVQTVPATAMAAKPAKKPYAAYTGATKEYVVKSGDTLGAIAYGNGINVRQLKELNGLTSDKLKIGQKLKIPAVKVVSKSAASATAKPKAKVVGSVADVKPVENPGDADTDAQGAEVPSAEHQGNEDIGAEVSTSDDEKVADEKPAASATSTYLVQEGDDMTGVSIRWGVSASDIRELNNLGENDQLVPGQVIKLPADAQQ